MERLIAVTLALNHRITCGSRSEHMHSCSTNTYAGPTLVVNGPVLLRSPSQDLSQLRVASLQKEKASANSNCGGQLLAKKLKRGQCLAGVRYFFFFLAAFFVAFFFVAIRYSSFFVEPSPWKVISTTIAALHIARAVCLTQDIAVTVKECQQIFSKKVLRCGWFGEAGKIVCGRDNEMLVALGR